MQSALLIFNLFEYLRVLLKNHSLCPNSPARGAIKVTPVPASIEGVIESVSVLLSFFPYSSFDNMPFAFADIEMIFDKERHAVDWIFRYGNPALAKLEKLPMEQLIGSSFGSLFSDMDSK